MKKRLFSLALALAMCLGLTVPAFAEDEFNLQGQHTSGAYTYSLLEDGTAMIVEFNKDYSTYTELEILSIPATLDGYKVTSLGTYSFSYSMPDGIKTVIIPEGVVRINSSAFSYQNTTTTSLVLPSTLQTIGEHAFNGWKALNTLEIPESVTSIGANAFFIFDPQEGQGLKTVICHSKDVRLGGGGLFDSTPFDGCVNCKFYGYPGSTLESLYKSRLATKEQSVQQGDGTWVSQKVPTGNTFHDISEAPGAGTPEQPAGTEAIPTNDKLAVNGVPAEPTVYKIGGGNYFKLRDLAVLLNGTSCQFDVGYDEASNSVTADSGKGYTKLDSDMQGPASANQTATLSNDKIIVNGQEAQVEVYKIDGGNYFKLRDLGKAFNFYVGWTAEQGMYIETDKPYAE